MNKYISPRNQFEMTMHDSFRYFGDVRDRDEFGEYDLTSLLAREGRKPSENMKELYRQNRYRRLVREAKGGY
jgi:hypothetical protein